MTNRMERKDIEEEDRKFMGDPRFSGRSNWDTYETSLTLDSDERTYRQMESISEMFNKNSGMGVLIWTKPKNMLRNVSFPKLEK